MLNLILIRRRRIWRSKSDYLMLITADDQRFTDTADKFIYVEA